MRGLHNGRRTEGCASSESTLPTSICALNTLEQPFRAGNHRFLLGRGIYIIENVGGEIPRVLDKSFELIPAPLKVQGEFASGAPVRLIGRL